MWTASPTHCLCPHHHCQPLYRAVQALPPPTAAPLCTHPHISHTHTRAHTCTCTLAPLACAHARPHACARAPTPSPTAERVPRLHGQRGRPGAVGPGAVLQGPQRVARHGGIPGGLRAGKGGGALAWHSVGAIMLGQQRGAGVGWAGSGVQRWGGQAVGCSGGSSKGGGAGRWEQQGRRRRRLVGAARDGVRCWRWGEDGECPVRQQGRSAGVGVWLGWRLHRVLHAHVEAQRWVRCAPKRPSGAGGGGGW